MTVLQEGLQGRPDGGEIAKEDHVVASGDQRYLCIMYVLRALNKLVDRTVAVLVTIH